MVKYHRDNLSIVFQALADPTRRKILQKLATGSPTVVQLARPFKISLPAVSKHLKVLESAGLIKRSKKGRESYFDVVTKPITDATKWIAAYEIFWQKRLLNLEKYLKNKGRLKKG
jgi:DNA-binding transcriptional ArsR family regulator